MFTTLEHSHLIGYTILSAYLTDLVMMAWYAVNLFRYFPSISNNSIDTNRTATTDVGIGNTPSATNSSSGSTYVHDILNKLFPLLITCFIGLCIQIVQYVLLLQGALDSDQVSYTLIVITCSEITPS